MIATTAWLESMTVCLFSMIGDCSSSIDYSTKVVLVEVFVPAKIAAISRSRSGPGKPNAAIGNSL